ncbi:MAG: 30S ribosomal protein S12 methylthiotransferase RimO [Lachnospiraceae bacterium]|nr:30S ribosomal protein S12 methylthiotransferase RimO [Lachnospiraceae bacterium]
MKNKVLFVSLGCDKNLVDSEEMIGILRRENFEFTDFEEEADVIIVNSCCFIGDAKEESINTILQMAEYRKNGRCKALIVTGCLAQRYKDEIISEIEEVDAVLGTSSYDQIINAIKEAFDGNKYEKFMSLDRLIVEEKDRILTTGGHFAYLKIAEGCNKRCTYCVIPSVRGNYRSVPMEELVDTAKKLADKGVKELILVAQETTVYGMDIYGKKMLPELLDKLCEVDGIVWIRLMYCYPEEITDELIAAIRDHDKVCNYIDMPIQHCNDRLLKLMGRKTNKAQIKEIAGKLRKEIKDIAIRTTLITGFPSETDEEHEELMDFVDEMEFERLGAFPYSKEEGTPAYSMDGQIPDEIKEKRRDAIMELQQEVAFDNGDKMIGKEILVMIEGKIVDENVYIGRTYMDAPSVDGNIFIDSYEELITGDFVKVKVTGSKDYDLIGEIVSR